MSHGCRQKDIYNKQNDAVFGEQYDHENNVYFYNYMIDNTII